jgi:hypothetical protein
MLQKNEAGQAFPLKGIIVWSETRVVFNNYEKQLAK